MGYLEQLQQKQEQTRRIVAVLHGCELHPTQPDPNTPPSFDGGPRGDDLDTPLHTRLDYSDEPRELGWGRAVEIDAAVIFPWLEAE